MAAVTICVMVWGIWRIYEREIERDSERGAFVYLIRTRLQVSRIVSSMKMTILLHLDLIFQNFRITLSSHLYLLKFVLYRLRCSSFARVFFSLLISRGKMSRTCRETLKENVWENERESYLSETRSNNLCWSAYESVHLTFFQFLMVKIEKQKKEQDFSSEWRLLANVYYFHSVNDVWSWCMMYEVQQQDMMHHSWKKQEREREREFYVVMNIWRYNLKYKIFITKRYQPRNRSK